MNDGGSIILNGCRVWLKGFASYSTSAPRKQRSAPSPVLGPLNFKDRKIRTNVISPGAIDAPIINSQVHPREAAEKLEAEFASATPLGRMGRPQEVASVALFLGSDESSYVAEIDLRWTVESRRFDTRTERAQAEPSPFFALIRLG